ncbi:MAG: hypothetical protein OXB86_01740 [Bdellovibrionales bacterium]|nr:hypothetical protein [Bdellovibrionales bacterium]
MKWRLLFCVFLFVCTACPPGPPERRRGDIRDLDGADARLRERDRLRNRSEEFIDSILEKRDSGASGAYKEYDGPECGESERCREICEDFKVSQKKCYQQPESLVRDLKDGLYELIRISKPDSVRVGPALFHGMLEMDKDLIEDLIEDEMSEGDIKSFLAWIAINEDIASVLDRADRQKTILKTAFKELGEKQEDSSQHVRTGLNVGLIGSDETFLFLASDEENVEAFKMGHEVLSSACSSRSPRTCYYKNPNSGQFLFYTCPSLDGSCKLEMYCARMQQARSRQRDLRDLYSCRTPEDSRRSRSSRGTACYIHGSDVWSYLYELIKDEEIRDSNLDDFVINVDRCKSVCGNTNDIVRQRSLIKGPEKEKCGIIL